MCVCVCVCVSHACACLPAPRSVSPACLPPVLFFPPLPISGSLGLAIDVWASGDALATRGGQRRRGGHPLAPAIPHVHALVQRGPRSLRTRVVLRRDVGQTASLGHAMGTHTEFHGSRNRPSVGLLPHVQRPRRDAARETVLPPSRARATVYRDTIRVLRVEIATTNRRSRKDDGATTLLLLPDHHHHLHLHRPDGTEKKYQHAHHRGPQ